MSDLFAYFYFKPLIELIKPDFEHWKPHKKQHQREMRVVHGFAEPEKPTMEKKNVYLVEYDNYVSINSASLFFHKIINSSIKDFGPEIRF